MGINMMNYLVPCIPAIGGYHVFLLAPVPPHEQSQLLNHHQPAAVNLDKIYKMCTRPGTEIVVQELIVMSSNSIHIKCVSFHLSRVCRKWKKIKQTMYR